MCLCEPNDFSSPHSSYSYSNHSKIWWLAFYTLEQLSPLFCTYSWKSVILPLLKSIRILGWMGTGGESAVRRFWFRGGWVGLCQKCSSAALPSLWSHRVCGCSSRWPNSLLPGLSHETYFWRLSILSPQIWLSEFSVEGDAWDLLGYTDFIIRWHGTITNDVLCQMARISGSAVS
jgi:hypothetical protein